MPSPKERKTSSDADQVAIRATEGTVFFVDLRNFTLLSSNYNPTNRDDVFVNDHETRYAARLRYLLQTVTDLYHACEAILDRHVESGRIQYYLVQPTGDGVMVALEGGNHAKAAISAATEMGLKLRRELASVVNPRLKGMGVRRSSDWLDFGIGICSGEYSEVKLADSIFPLGKTILGAAPNLASRVESATKDHGGDTRILIAEPTIQLLCNDSGIDIRDHRLVEDAFGVRHIWRHKFPGTRELSLYATQLDDDIQPPEPRGIYHDAGNRRS